MNVFVVVESSDSRRSRDHKVRIHGIFKDKEKALFCMRTEAKRTQEKYICDIKFGENWIKILGEDYFVFEIKEGKFS